MMHSRQELAWRFFVSLEENDLMDVAFPFQWVVAQPCVGAYDASALYSFLDKRNQTVRRGICYGAHSDPPDALSIFLSGHCNQCLPFRLPASNAPFWATKIGFINFNSSNEPVAPGSYHCAPQFVQPGPCCLVAAQTQDALEPKGISPGFLVCHKPHCLKPSAQRLPRSLKDRACGGRRLSLARCAAQEAPGGRPGLACTASRATKAVGPPKAPQIVSARLLCSKPRVEFLKCPRIIHAADWLEIMAHHYILRLREGSG